MPGACVVGEIYLIGIHAVPPPDNVGDGIFGAGLCPHRVQDADPPVYARLRRQASNSERYR